MTPTFQGEVQFRRWSDSSTQGVQVTFALPDSDELEPLKGLEGKRFMAVLVRIGDDEQPLAPGAEPTRKTAKVGPLCLEAVGLCKLSDFQNWIGAANELEAEVQLKGRMAITSRKELDTDADTGRAFVEQIRIPFMHWQRERRK